MPPDDNSQQQQPRYRIPVVRSSSSSSHNHAAPPNATAAVAAAKTNARKIRVNAAPPAEQRQPTQHQHHINIHVGRKNRSTGSRNHTGQSATTTTAAAAPALNNHTGGGYAPRAAAQHNPTNGGNQHAAAAAAAAAEVPESHTDVMPTPPSPQQPRRTSVQRRHSGIRRLSRSSNRGGNNAFHDSSRRSSSVAAGGRGGGITLDSNSTRRGGGALQGDDSNDKSIDSTRGISATTDNETSTGDSEAISSMLKAVAGDSRRSGSLNPKPVFRRQWSLLEANSGYVNQGKHSGVAAKLLRIKGVVQPFTLYFHKNEALEIAYRSQLVLETKSAVRVFAFILFFVMGCIVVLEAFLMQKEKHAAVAHREDDIDDAMRLVIVLGVLSVALSIAIVLPTCCTHRRESFMYQHWQHIYAFALALTGILWVMSSLVHNKEVETTTSSAAAIFYMAAVTLFVNFLLFTHVAAIISIIGMTFFIAAPLYASSAEDDIVTGQAAVLVVFALVLFLIGAWAAGVQRRRAFVYGMNVLLMSREEMQLRADQMKLKKHLYDMVLSQYQLSDTNIELKSPVEEAMNVLRNIHQRYGSSLPSEALIQVSHVMKLLASASDIFKPQIGTQLKKKGVLLDTEVSRWLMTLADGEEDGGNDTVSRSKSVSLRGRMSSSVGQHPLNGGEDHHQRRLSHMGPSSHVMTEEEKFHVLLQSTEEWDFDMFEVHSLTKGRPLFFIGMALFKKYGFIRRFHIDMKKLSNFLTNIEAGYHDLPYHNSTHAADVARSVHFFFTRGKLRDFFLREELLAVLVGALIHDFDHPGVNNNFHIATRDEKAILYNDRHVLENHHVARAFRVLLRPENDILSECSKAQFSIMRKIIIDVVLATDLASHFDFLSAFRLQFQNESVISISSSLRGKGKKAVASRLTVMKMILKVSDVGHACKSKVLHEKWSGLIVEEFFRQGDRERTLSLKVSPFMDRNITNGVAKGQLGFIDFLVKPMLKLFVEFLRRPENEVPCMRILAENRAMWKAKAKAGDSEDVSSSEEGNEAEERVRSSDV